MQGGVHRLLRHAVSGDLLQDAQDQLLHRFRVFRVGAFQPADEGGFTAGRIKTAHRRWGRAQFGGFQRMAQRRTAVIQQHIAEQPRPQGRQRIGNRPQQPAQHDMSLVMQMFRIVQRVINQIGDRRGVSPLGGNR